ncbi:MAG: GAP family protein [Solirubrobacteraceae bacterium]|nr:GAP family protein [Solirubrobacteraceae bacterium]
MVAPTLGELLPVALAVALSPIPIIAVVVVVGSPRAKTSGPAFALGWIVGLLAVTTVAVLLLGGGDDTVHDEPSIDWLSVGLGALLLGLAGKTWAGRPRPGEELKMPSWMETLGSAPAGRAIGLGAALSGANPKNIAMALAAATTIAEAGLNQSEASATVVGFVALGSTTVVGAVLIALFGGRRGAAALASLREFMTEHNVAIMVVVLVLLGGKLVGDGLGDLFA